MSPMVSGLETATLHDPNASSHTDRIRDTVRQMSALALCSRHECCWHTHQKKKKRGGGGSREKQGEQGGEDGWHKRKENRGEEENRKEVCVCPRKSDVRPRRDEIHSVMFLSDSNQLCWRVTLQV